MFKTVLDNLIGSVTMLMIVTNTIICASILYPVTILKLIFRFRAATLFFNRVLNFLAITWIGINNIILGITRKIDWQVTGTDNLRTDRWYLVLSNHQSWTDILVLQKILHRKTPFIKFFLKKELIWVPIMGLAWWALDFPFMKRYTSSFLEKHPHLKGKDIEITKKACAKFRDMPFSIMNFVEGTRFTPQKHDRQGSPYRNLLKPKSGGIGFVFSTMGEYLTSILNVTIAYPGGPYSFWDFICGRTREILVDVEEIPVSQELIGDYINDPVHREKFQGWLNGLWEDKDRKIDLMLGQGNGPLGMSAGAFASRDKTETETIQ